VSSLRAVARGYPGPLWRNIVDVPSPAAGADVTVTVPGKRAWQLLAVTATLAASSTSGNRIPTLTLEDTFGVPLARIASPTAITASSSPVCSWTPGVGAAVVVVASMACLTLPADWYMQPGEQLTITGHTATNDQWSNVRVTVLETYVGDAAAERNREQAIYDHWSALQDLITYGEPT